MSDLVCIFFFCGFTIFALSLVSIVQTGCTRSLFNCHPEPQNDNCERTIDYWDVSFQCQTGLQSLSDSGGLISHPLCMETGCKEARLINTALWTNLTVTLRFGYPTISQENFMGIDNLLWITGEGQKSHPSFWGERRIWIKVSLTNMGQGRIPLP